MATFYNQATLSYNGRVASSNITTGEILEVVSATKSAVPEVYTVGEDNTFIISIVNSGSASFQNVTITDNLGSYEYGTEPQSTAVPLTYEEGTLLYYVNGIQQPAPTVTSFSPLTITGINIPAGGNVSIIYSAEANQFAPLGEGAQIVNTAEITGAGTSPITVSETITPVNGADLSITKTLSPTAVEENGQVTYTFLIQNYGSEEAAAADEVVFSDTFSPVLSSLTAVYNGTPWTITTDYTYDTASGAFASVPGAITVPAAQFSQDPDTGAWSVQPGESTLVITGNMT